LVLMVRVPLLQEVEPVEARPELGVRLRLLGARRGRACLARLREAAIDDRAVEGSRAILGLECAGELGRVAKARPSLSAAPLLTPNAANAATATSASASCRHNLVFLMSLPLKVEERRRLAPSPRVRAVICSSLFACQVATRVDARRAPRK